MKKILLLFVCVVSFYSCDKEEEPLDLFNEPIAHEFLLYSATVNGEEITPDTCAQGTNLDLNFAGTGFYTIYDWDTENGCHETGVASVSWREISGGRYKIISGLPFLGEAIPVKEAYAVVKGEELTLTFNYKELDCTVVYRRN
ncbi:hypothetical protein [Maribacter sp.]|uniref:hypothetical protein n=1 Tax=Maribacter sp. TaxID=1897614 RepID=UPI0025BD978A|nr:hypothetical protein [Maribacter sp.]